jgi:phenylalanyl-tRNA synthetase beta chain
MSRAELSAIADSRTAGKRFEPLPRFPAAERDLAVVVDADVESAVLKRVIETASAGVIISNVRLFDTYAGLGILTGKKSLAFSFSLRAEDHTLTDEEIKRGMDAIIDALKNREPRCARVSPAKPLSLTRREQSRRVLLIDRI